MWALHAEEVQLENEEITLAETGQAAKLRQWRKSKKGKRFDYVRERLEKLRVQRGLPYDWMIKGKESLVDKIKTGDLEPEDLPALIEFFERMGVPPVLKMTFEEWLAAGRPKMSKKVQAIVSVLEELYDEYQRDNPPETDTEWNWRSLWALRNQLDVMKDVKVGEDHHLVMVFDNNDEFWILDQGLPVWRSSDFIPEEAAEEWNRRLNEYGVKKGRIRDPKTIEKKSYEKGGRRYRWTRSNPRTEPRTDAEEDALDLYEDFNMQGPKKGFSKITLSLPAKNEPLVWLGKMAEIVYESDKEGIEGQLYVHKLDEPWPDIYATHDRQTLIIPIHDANLILEDGWMRG